MKVKDFAMRMMNEKHLRAEAEKMLGKKWEDMTQEERWFTASVMCAFSDLGVNF